jgi:hypothetical protein
MTLACWHDSFSFGSCLLLIAGRYRLPACVGKLGEAEVCAAQRVNRLGTEAAACIHNTKIFEDGQDVGAVWWYVKHKATKHNTRVASGRCADMCFYYDYEARPVNMPRPSRSPVRLTLGLRYVAQVKAHNTF